MVCLKVEVSLLKWIEGDHNIFVVNLNNLRVSEQLGASLVLTQLVALGVEAIVVTI